MSIRLEAEKLLHSSFIPPEQARKAMLLEPVTVEERGVGYYTFLDHIQQALQKELREAADSMKPTIEGICDEINSALFSGEDNIVQCYANGARIATDLKEEMHNFSEITERYSNILSLISTLFNLSQPGTQHEKTLRNNQDVINKGIQALESTAKYCDELASEISQEAIEESLEKAQEILSGYDDVEPPEKKPHEMSIEQAREKYLSIAAALRTIASDITGFLKRNIDEQSRTP